MLIKSPSDIKPSEITSESDYKNRRQFLQQMGKVAAATAITLGTTTQLTACQGATNTGMDLPEKYRDYPDITRHALSTKEKLTDYDSITSYCNFYEFGTSKSAPSFYSILMQTRPWTVEVEGEVEKPLTLNIEDILRRFALQEYVYRLRCVEGWSMVIPWVGFPLADLIKYCKPTSNAKYVHFVSLHNPEQMIGQKRDVLDWPYEEGLRIDEATHPLTIMSVGMYGNELLNQNGAPIRLVVPWKYGFKSIKSVVKLRFTEKQPVSTWTKSAEDEYGFYANVNPEVDHPRWSQGKERRIGEYFKRKTLLFNGYADQVASLYSGMDLHKHF
ncbi:protein-methionine-sulfoxide reductase catalytic subunit MsrP [Candidatus Albibeggiatoa sp. nov. NOAA]|uniref:protein-methionine-sulfoxide reductase catalytic subunit MsrP n=1 Tax=Candidatus Albibeggiatoa sp. nov. NOAA TaxID=3162724 RepID=UPI0032FEEB11|nr:protein-methionine-sulfoxide reductase catalytic subunit MsrP [Thiotrichaceae bacterium]